MSFEVLLRSHEKLAPRFPSSRGHPEANTKIRSLSGIVITEGGNMNIPSPIKTAATTRSITRNGRKIRNLLGTRK